MSTNANHNGKLELHTDNLRNLFVLNFYRKEFFLYMIKQIATTKKVITIGSIVLLIISLTQPAFYTTSNSSDSLNLHSVFIFFLG